MANDYTWLQLRQLDQQLAPWHTVSATAPRPREGWLRTLRKSLGMSTGALAKRLHISQPAVVQLEKGETKETVTLGSLRKAAAALDCDLVYALVPRKPLENMVRDQADAVARKELRTVSHSMALENQRPGPAVEEQQLHALREQLLAGSWQRLWK